MMDDENVQTPVAPADDQQDASVVSPTATPESVEQEESNGDEQATV